MIFIGPNAYNLHHLSCFHFRSESRLSCSTFYSSCCCLRGPSCQCEAS